MSDDQRHRNIRPRRSGKRFFFTAVLIAVVLFAVIKGVQYGLQPHHRQANHSKTTANSATAAVASSEDSLQGFQVVLWHQGCSSGCPDYALHYKAGKLQYTGIRGVAKMGKDTVDFDRYHQKRLLDLVEKAAFFDLSGDYTLKSRHCHPKQVGASRYVLGITLNGQTKKVAVNEGCTNIPPKLADLVKGIDRLADSKRWVTAASPATTTAGH